MPVSPLGDSDSTPCRFPTFARSGNSTSTATAIGGSNHHQLELIPSRGSIALSRRPPAVLNAGIISGIEQLVVWDKEK